MAACRAWPCPTSAARGRLIPVTRNRTPTKPSKGKAPPPTTATPPSKATPASTSTPAQPRPVGRLTPVGVPGLIYGAIRLIHLVLIGASLPLGMFAFVSATHPGGAAKFLVVGVGLVLALFVLAMDHAAYPVTLRGAVVRTVPLVLTLGLGWWNHAGDIPIAAHHALSSLMAALTFTLALVTVQAYRTGDAARQSHGPILRSLVMPITAAAAVGTAIVGWPLLQGAVSDPSWTVATIIAPIAWLVQTATTTKAWYAQSIYGGPRTPDTVAREMASTRWSDAMAITTGLVLLGFAVAALW